MTATLRIAAVLAVGSVLVLGLPSGAVAGDDEAVPSRLTVKGQPLAALVRTEPMAPFVAFEPGYISVGTQAGGAGQTVSGGKKGGNRRKMMLVSGAMGAGAGFLYGFKMCENHVCPYFGWGGLVGLGAGFGVGAALAALSDN